MTKIHPARKFRYSGHFWSNFLRFVSGLGQEHLIPPWNIVRLVRHHRTPMSKTLAPGSYACWRLRFLNDSHDISSVWLRFFVHHFWCVSSMLTGAYIKLPIRFFSVIVDSAGFLFVPPLCISSSWSQLLGHSSWQDLVSELDIRLLHCPCLTTWDLRHLV